MLIACLARASVAAPICILWYAAGFAGCARPTSTLDRVIEQSTNASGGRAAIESIHSIEVDLHIVDPGFEADATYRAMRPGKMRIDIVAGGKHVFTEAFNGKRGWEWQGKGDPVNASPNATAALRHGVELPGKLLGLHELQGRGHHLELGADERLDGDDYHVLHLTMADGYSTALYVNARNGLITRRRDVRPLHVDIDPTPTTIESRTSDFRNISGVIFGFATTEVDLKTGKVLETATMRSIKVNQPIADTFFDRL